MIRPILTLATMLSLTVAASVPAAAQETLPVDSVFEEWLAAFNSGDPSDVEEFYLARADSPNVMFLRELAGNTCGFDLVRVEEREARRMNVLLAERCFPSLHRLELALGPTMPAIWKGSLSVPSPCRWKAPSTR